MGRPGRPRKDKKEKSVNFSICLPPDMLETVDNRRGETTRSAFIQNAIKSSGMI